MSDFGLACLAKKGKGKFAVRQTAGTVGYADPKYIARYGEPPCLLVSPFSGLVLYLIIRCPCLCLLCLPLSAIGFS